MTVVLVDFDAYSDSIRLKACDQCCSAAQEWVQYNFSLEAEQFDASPRELDRERRGMPNLPLTLAAEVPYPVRPLNELVSSNVRFSFPQLLPSALVHDQYRFDWRNHVGC